MGRALLIALGCCAGTLTLLAIAAPIVQSLYGFPFGESIYSVLSEICHQYPTRSFWIMNRPTALCARCTTAYASLAACCIYLYVAAVPIEANKRVILGFLLLLPGIADGTLQLMTFYTSNNIVRSLTGTAGGIGVALILSILALPRGNIMKRTAKVVITTVLTCIVCGLSPAIAEDGKIRLPSGTVVAVRLEQMVNPEVQAIGSQVQAVVASDVQVDGVTVIKAGAAVIANVEEAEKAGSIGKGAKLTVVLRSVQAVDGTSIPLSGSYRTVGESKEGSTVALGALLCPLFLLREGDDTQLAAGAETRAMTLGEATIRVSAHS